MESLYTIACAVLLIVVAWLLAYIWSLKGVVVLWRDAYANEAQRHAQTRDELDRARMTGRVS